MTTDRGTQALLNERDHEIGSLKSEIERLRAALVQVKHGAEYPDELGDIINVALGVDEQTTVNDG